MIPCTVDQLKLHHMITAARAMIGQHSLKSQSWGGMATGDGIEKWQGGGEEYGTVK